MKAISRFFRYCALMLQLWQAQRKADRLQRQTGVTQYVIKQGKRLIVVTRKQYRIMVSNSKARYVTAEQMYQGCFYCTRWYNKDNPTPTEVILRKRRMWLAANGL